MEKKEQGSWDVAERLEKEIRRLAADLEAMRVAEYVELLQNPKRLLMLNFVAGLSRGLGMAIGFTLLGAVALIILQRLVLLNLPVIGGFIAEIVRLVQEQLRL